MARRALAWLVTLPLVAAGLLCGHAIAYRATGEPLGPAHDYLGHGVQLAVVLATLGLVALSAQQRGGRTSPIPYVVVAAVGFACQEHVELVAHGEPGLLLADATFLVGLALQAPIVLACFAVARWILGAASVGAPSRPPATSDVLVAAPVAPIRVPRTQRLASRRGRAPPATSAG